MGQKECILCSSKEDVRLFHQPVADAHRPAGKYWECRSCREEGMRLYWRMPRSATSREKLEAKELIAFKQGFNISDPEMEPVDNAYFAVFDNYITDGPGYSGKYMLVVFPGSVGMYDAFIWDAQGNIERVPQDPDLADWEKDWTEE